MSFPSAPPLRPLASAWRFPRAQVLTWRGLKIVLLSDRELPVVHLRLLSLGGRSVQPAPGAAGLAATLARHGTARYDSAGLAWRQDLLGARVGTAASTDTLRTSVHALSEHLDDAVELLAEVGLRATFPVEQVVREREAAAERRRHALKQPDTAGRAWLARSLYDGHPYGQRPARPEDLLALEPELLQGWFASARAVDRSLLIAVGDLSADQLLERLEQHVGDWTTVAGPVPEVAPPPRPSRRVILVDRPGSEQASVMLGLPGLLRSDDDYAAARVLVQALGGGASARLFRELRDRRGLTYGCYAGLDTGRLAGDLSASFSCATDKADEALQALFDELERTAAEPLPDEELEHARRYLVGAFPRAGASLSGLADLLSLRWVHRLPDDCWSTWPGRLEGVDRDACARAASRLLDLDHAVLVVVGRADELEPACAHHGTVERKALDELPV